jgi:hypothetical protein
MKRFFDYVLYFASTTFCLGLLGFSFYFYPLIATIVVLLSLLGVACFYLYRFVMIIMILEDDFSQVIDSLNNVENSVNGVLEMKMFFDTPEVQHLVRGVMDSVRMAKFDLNTMIKKFVDRSKQKYIIIEEDEEQEELAMLRKQAEDREKEKGGNSVEKNQ